MNKLKEHNLFKISKFNYTLPISNLKIQTFNAKGTEIRVLLLVVDKSTWLIFFCAVVEVCAANKREYSSQ